MNRVIITKPMIGIYAMQVCAKEEVTDEEILLVCNKENPSGTNSEWSRVFRKIDKDHGRSCLPARCNHYSDRMHFLVFVNL